MTVHSIENDLCQLYDAASVEQHTIEASRTFWSYRAEYPKSGTVEVFTPFVDKTNLFIEVVQLHCHLSNLLKKGIISMKKILTGLLAIASLATLKSQNLTISGYVRDAQSGEELLFATVAAPTASVGISTNEYGFFSLSLPQGKHRIVCSYVGYQILEQEIDLQKNLRLDLSLQAAALLKEVVVSASNADHQLRSAEMGAATLDIQDTKLLPVLFGEQDILKTIQLLPGVSPNSEGNAGFFVRGGDADQNLVLLDEAPVYNASHLLGFFSVFNSDALKDVKLYKGAMPAQYGGRASSVLDIRMKNGNNKSWGGSGGIGLIASRFTLEGPLQQDKGSIILSGRRTYADLLLKAFTSSFDETDLYFYDFNVKANYAFGEKDRLFLSGYFGRDVFGLGNGVGLDWGNTTATLRWNHIFSDKLFANTSFIYSDFDYGFGVDNAGTAISLQAGIYDYNLKQDFNWYPNAANSLQFGWNAIYHRFKPGKFVSEDPNGTSNTEVDLASQQALETGLYADNEQSIGERLTVQYGLRLSAFSNVGPYEEKTYNEADEVIGRVQHGSGAFFNTYLRLEPRLSTSYLLNDVSSVKLSYARSNQYLHQLSNSTSGTPTDLWLPSTPLIKPETSDQFAIGYFRNFADNAFEFSTELYYKNLSGLVEYEDGARTFLNPDLDAELVFGRGRAYGAEFFLKKNTGKLTGWVSYTLSKSERQFDAINSGAWFSARQDRTHDISVVATYRLSPRWTLSAAWVYYTGDAVTFPAGKYEVDGSIVNLFTDRNADRMPDYHRLDLGATLKLKERDNWKSELSFSIYNAYNRKNAYSIDFREADGGSSEAVKTSLFGIVPAVTWNFSFK
ncbi:MAG: TonB-dependent receptor [Saprospiraceae bacterium]